MPKLKVTDEQRFAEFSEDRAYRYSLSIIWNDKMPPVALIGLNQSNADQFKDDPTIRREKCFARDWGFGGLIKVNVFPVISTDPRFLFRFNPVQLYGTEPKGSIEWIREKIGQCPRVVACWGVHAGLVDPEREQAILHAFPKLYCLGTNKGLSPRHPLRLAKSTKLEPFNF